VIDGRGLLAIPRMSTFTVAQRFNLEKGFRKSGKGKFRRRGPRGVRGSYVRCGFDGVLATTGRETKLNQGGSLFCGPAR